MVVRNRKSYFIVDMHKLILKVKKKCKYIQTWGAKT